jgi:TonB family protein
VLSLSLLSSLAALPRIAHAVEPPPGTNGDAASLAAAKQLLGERKFRAAAKAYAEANEHAGGHCGECLLGLARAELGLGDLDAGIATARDAVAALTGDALLGLAYQHLGDLFLQRAGACQPPLCGSAAIADLTAAGEAYETALASGSADRSLALIGLAKSRLRRSLYPEAAEAASEALAAAGRGPAAVAARVLLCRARGTAHLPPSHLPDDKASPPELLQVKRHVTKPLKIWAPAPIFTEEARKKQLTGVVILEAIIDEDGCVANAHVLQGLPAGLDRSALRAVSDWVFEPATLEGRPVRVYYSLTVSFKVKFGPPPH